jgi:uncharacterized protein
MADRNEKASNSHQEITLKAPLSSSSNLPPQKRGSLSYPFSQGKEEVRAEMPSKSLSLSGFAGKGILYLKKRLNINPFRLAYMKKITEKQAIELLKKYSNSEEDFEKVLAHVKAVQKVAVRIASKVPGIDMYKIKIGGLLHDIGRFSCPPGKDNCRHGLAGAEILRKEGLPDIALIAERHMGAGITKEDIIEQKLDLPGKDFVPLSREEKIVCHADNLIFDDKEVSFDKVTERFRKELGEKYVKRFVKLKNEVEKMQKG